MSTINENGTNRKRVCVCVLGDIGHSPRMQYHSLSLAQSGFDVDIVGYHESKPHEHLLSNPRIKIHPVRPYKNINFLPKHLNYILKVIVQLFYLFYTFLQIITPSHILVQNPPSIPALFVVWLVARIRGAYFVIDWHNYGYSILSLSLGKSHLFVRIYRWLEMSLGKRADFAFCVSKSMQNDLLDRLGIKAIVLYDKPYSYFKPLSSLDRHDFLVKLQVEHSQLKPQNVNSDHETLFTKMDQLTGNIEIKKDAPILLVSSTSWTEDEDFQILLDALYEFDCEHVERLVNSNGDTKVLCVITGKGPLKQYYIDKLTDYGFKHTKFLFPWLAAEDYPTMLGSADLGICLHKSSSGLDLPMKVVDMFGSRLPVCAYRYQTISELVHERKNGLLFDDSQQLVERLVELFADYPKCDRLKQYRSHIEDNFCKHDWDLNWRQNALPVFTLQSMVTR